MELKNKASMEVCSKLIVGWHQIQCTLHVCLLKMDKVKILKHFKLFNCALI